MDPSIETLRRECPMCKTFRDFAEFYEHPFIKSIADDEKWTVSDKTKKPIDMFVYKYRHQITGATFTNNLSLVSLPELCSLIPNARNNAYFMDALTDNFVVLDIEKKCPDDIKKELLQTPYIYGEISLSGQGYHLIYPLPDCFSDYPDAQTKIVMKEPHGYYEILLQHYVTFTRNMLPKATGNKSFENIFKKFAKTQVKASKHDINVNELKPDDIPFADNIIFILSSVEYQKTPADFFDDMSKYEYGFMGFLYYKLKNIINIKDYRESHEYTDNEIAWLLYETAKDKIPYRPKHDEFRNNLPWLLYLAGEIIARGNNKDKKE